MGCCWYTWTAHCLKYLLQTDSWSVPFPRHPFLLSLPCTLQTVTDQWTTWGETFAFSCLVMNTEKQSDPVFSSLEFDLCFSCVSLCFCGIALIIFIWISKNRGIQGLKKSSFSTHTFFGSSTEPAVNGEKGCVCCVLFYHVWNWNPFFRDLWKSAIKPSLWSTNVIWMHIFRILNMTESLNEDLVMLFQWSLNHGNQNLFKKQEVCLVTWLPPPFSSDP